jgi:tRNA pseudouridine32 synthase/23S rRNA pseudouridine746 synthase
MADTVSNGPAPRAYAPPPADTLKLHHVDADIIVAEKPSGLLSVPGRGEDRQFSALSILTQRFGETFVVHRLDMDTSGLIIFARNREAQSALSRLFEAQAVEKRYTAKVHGTPVEDAGRITLAIGRKWEDRPARCIDEISGKPSETCWQLKHRGKNTSLLEVTPRTGRTHQIRLHLAAIGHPILGDRLYGNTETFDDRLCLHASALVFEHSRSGKLVTFESPAPFVQ